MTKHEEFDDKHSTISKMVLASASPAYLRAFSKAAQGHVTPPTKRLTLGRQ